MMSCEVTKRTASSTPSPSCGDSVKFSGYQTLPSNLRRNNSVKSPETVSEATGGGCKCCPYGFHIDLDFIRFCETMSTGVRRRPGSEARRARRRQTSSMEVMLGLIPAFPVAQGSPGQSLASPVIPTRKIAVKTPLPTIPQEAKDPAKFDGEFCDVLGRFEATFEESKSRLASPANTLSRNGRISLPSPDSWHDLSPVCRTGSSSSLSSIHSSASGFRNSLQRAPLASPERSSIEQSFNGQPPADDAMSVASTCSTVNVLALQAIREQLATSLERMKELEEQVKTIPILQVKLSVVEEEKRQLSQQLREHAKVSRQEGAAQAVRRKDSSQQTLEVTGASEAKDMSVDRGCDPIFELLPSVPTTCEKGLGTAIATREIGSGDTIDTREIGIGSAIRTCEIGIGSTIRTCEIGISFTPDVRNAGTETTENSQSQCLNCEKRREVRAKPCLKCFQQSLKRYVSVETNTDIETNNNKSDGYRSYVKYSLSSSSVLRRMSQLREAPPTLTFDNSTNTDRAEYRSVSCLTDLVATEIKTTQELDLAIEQLKLALQNEAEQNKPQLCDSAVQTTSETQRIIQVVPPLVKKFDAEIQVSFPVPEKCNMRSVSVMCKPEVSQKHVTAKPTTRDVASSDSTVSGLMCDRCSKRSMKHVGVGAFHINDTWCEKCSVVKTRSIGVGDYKAGESGCEKCKKVRTRSVGVGENLSLATSEVSTTKRSVQDSGTDAAEFPCERCSTGAIKSDFSVQTTNETVSDLSVQTEPDTGCEQCRLHRMSTSHDSLSTSPSVKPPPGPSRIPKLSHGALSCQSDVSEQSYASTDTRSNGVKSPTSSRIIAPKTRLVLPLPRSAPNSPLAGRRGAQKPAGKISTASFVAGLTSAPFEEDIQSEPGVRHGSGNSLDKMTRQISKRAISEPEAILSDFSEDDSETMSESGRSDNCDTDDTPSPKTSSQAQHSRVANELRKRVEPTKEMKAALKVLNDSLSNSRGAKGNRHVTAAISIISHEWFNVTSKKESDPKVVEDYLDELEAVSRDVLAKVVNMTDANGNTAMHYGVSHGNFLIVSLLLETKVCDAGKPNRAGYTPIMLVCLAPIVSEEHKMVVKRLFDASDINARASQHGQTALMLAVSHGRLDMVMLLVAAGADINIQDVDGSTALMCAAEHGHIDIVKFLIAQPDCDINLKDNDGSTALSISVEAGHRDIGVLLYAHQTFKRGEAYSSMRLVRRSSRSSTPGSLSPTGSRRESATLV